MSYETWYHLTNAELNLLETVDLMLLRGILNTPKSTPKEIMYLELGIVPFREIIRRRRLGFLSYILKQNKDSLVNKFFECQRKNRKAKDWVTTIIDDMEQLNLKMTFEEIKCMKKDVFMNIVKRKSDHKTLKDLEKLKEKHSKVRKLKHNVLKIQKYLTNNENLKIEECQLLFKLRSRSTDLKMNQQGRFESHECDACQIENESQEHIYECKVIEKMQVIEDQDENVPYKKIMSGTIIEQTKIAKIFNQKMKIVEKLKKEKT